MDYRQSSQKDKAVNALAPTGDSNRPLRAHYLPLFHLALTTAGDPETTLFGSVNCAGVHSRILKLKNILSL